MGKRKSSAGPSDPASHCNLEADQGKVYFKHRAESAVIENEGMENVDIKLQFTITSNQVLLKMYN